MTLALLLFLSIKTRKNFLQCHEAISRIKLQLAREVRLTGQNVALEVQNAIAINKLPVQFPTFLGDASIDSFHARQLTHELLLLKPRVILELGAGTSSVLVALSVKHLNYGHVKHIAIDHDARYLLLAQDLAQANGVADCIDFQLCPLAKRKADGFEWYTGVRELIADGTTIDILVVDGPPATGKGQEKVREFALPELYDLLSPTCTIFLDDTNREGEASIATAWAERFPDLAIEQSSRGKGHVAFRRIQ